MSHHQLRGARRPAEIAPTPLEMRIALAHYIERCHEQGIIMSYAEAAERLGVSSVRVSQLLDLLLVGGAEASTLHGQPRGRVR